MAFGVLRSEAGASGEVLGARWAEVDMAAKVWTIPGKRWCMRLIAPPLRLPSSKGESKSRAAMVKAEGVHFARSWIAAAISPIEEGGLGMSLPDAISDAAEKRPNEAYFGLSAETPTHCWTHYVGSRDRAFSRPLSSLPDRTPKKSFVS